MCRVRAKDLAVQNTEANAAKEQNKEEEEEVEVVVVVGKIQYLYLFLKKKILYFAILQFRIQTVYLYTR